MFLMDLSYMLLFASGATLSWWIGPKCRLLLNFIGTMRNGWEIIHFTHSAFHSFSHMHEKCWQPLDVELHDAQSRTYGLKAQVGVIGGVLPGFVTGIHKDSVRRWNLWFPSAGLFIRQGTCGEGDGDADNLPPNISLKSTNTLQKPCWQTRRTENKWYLQSCNNE